MSITSNRCDLAKSCPVTSVSKLFKYHVEDYNFAAGCFGKILLAKDPILEKEVVIKKIPKSSGNAIEVSREIEAGKKLKHKNISKFYEHFSDNENDFLVFERIHGKDLYHIIEKRGFVPYPERDARKMFKQILKAVRYCHDHDVVHRDIKLENILYDNNGKATLIDFGLCDLVKRGNQSERFCGSIDYVAPEVLGKKTYNGFQADVFSLGVVLYTLLFAEFPYVAADRVNAIKKKTEIPKPHFSETKMKQWKVSLNAKDLISKMLKTNPSERITLEEVRKHPFFRSKKGVSSLIQFD